MNLARQLNLSETTFASGTVREVGRGTFTI